MKLWKAIKRQWNLCLGCRFGMPPLFFSMVPGCPDCRDRYKQMVELMNSIWSEPKKAVQRAEKAKFN